MARVLFISGVGDDNLGVVRGKDARGNLSWVLGGSCDIQYHLGLPTGSASSILLFGPDARQPQVTLNSKPSLLFNQISDPETHAGALKRCAILCRQLAVPVINRPEKIMLTGRDRVSKMLQGIQGVNMPRTLRFSPGKPDEVYEHGMSKGFDFPMIVRLPGFHNGRNMVLLRGREDAGKLHVFPFDGRDFFLTQFVDCSDDAGLYFKTRLIVIDGEPYVRHSYFNRSWNIHADEAFTFMEKNPGHYTKEEILDRAEAGLKLARSAVKEIAARIGLEYFGIDCHIDDQGNVLVFEANATMNVLVSPIPFEHQRVLAIRQSVRDMLARRLGAGIN